MENKNAEYIANLKRISIQHPGCTVAINSAIRALKAEGRSPWRKVTKRHPGKKWDAKRVLVAHRSGAVDTFQLPRIHWNIWWKVMSGFGFTHWQPWPEHPEKEVK